MTINVKYLIGAKISSLIFIGCLISSLYLLNFPNARFISLSIFFDVIFCIYFTILNIKYITCNYIEYYQENFRYYLTCNIYLSNFVILIYCISFPCGEKCLTLSESTYSTISMTGSFLNCVISFLIRQYTNTNRIEVTNLREIIVVPTYRDQLANFMDEIKGKIINKDISEKEEITKTIIDEILSKIFEEKNERICSICLTNINQYQKLVKLECNHTYHTNCLFECYKNKIKTCSLCRKDYLKNNVI